MTVDLDQQPEEETPRFVPPMFATLTDEPFSDPHWVYEPKLDGVRLVASRRGSAVELVSRNDKRQNDAYPEIVEAVADLRTDRLVLDGEVVAFEDGRTSFARLQGRMQLRDAHRARRTGIAVHYYLFDLLHLDGRSTRQLQAALAQVPAEGHRRRRRPAALLHPPQRARPGAPRRRLPAGLGGPHREEGGQPLPAGAAVA